MRKVKKKVAPRHKKAISKFKLEFRNQFKIAMLAALGFVIAFSWRDFISSSLNAIILRFGITDKIYLYQLFSAIVVTIIAVLIILIVSKVRTEEEEPQ